MRAVHGAVVQVQQAGATKLGQQGGMQARPDADLGPVPQPTPGRHPGAAHRLGRDIAPRDTGPQYEQDSDERHTVGNTQPSGIPAAPFGSGRQQRSRPLPQVVRNKISTHPDTLPIKIAGHKIRSPTHSETISYAGTRLGNPSRAF